MGKNVQVESLLNRSLEIIASNKITLTRAASSSSASQTIEAPVGATVFIAFGTLSNVSPALTFPITYYAPDGTGGILWGIRGYYDAAVGAVKFFNESYNAGITASEYVVDIQYYLLKEKSK